MNRQRMGHKPVETFIKFEDAGTSSTGKTRVWAVVNTMWPEERDEIGYVSWHGPWRKYVYHSPNDSFYDADCLRLIADFCETKTLEHKGGTKNGRQNT